jgi:tRNA pseudouridine38-40 synthase
MMGVSSPVENATFYHYFIKAWYDGQSYSGSQYQPGLRTVDGAIVDALRELRYLPVGPPHTEHLKVAGRTDKGVSALSAVYYVQVLKPLHPCEVNEKLKASNHAIMIWSVARLRSPVNPRHAVHRVYKYFHVMGHELVDVGNVRKGLQALSGDHDFKGFTKARLNPELRTARTMDTATVEQEGDVLVITFQSQGFLWEQVRRMVAFLLAHGNDVSITEQVAAVLCTGEQPNMEPASPAGLVLWNVQYGPEIRWENVEGCREQFFKSLRARYIDARSRSSILEAIFSTLHES